MEQVVETTTQQPPAAAPAAPSVETSAQPEKQPSEGTETKVETEETPQRRESRRQRQLNRERNARVAAETEARLLRERIERLEGAKAQPKADGVDQDAPKREQFEHYEDFLRAEARYYARKEAREAARQEREESTKKESESRQKETQDQIARQWQERIEDARDDIEDFDEVCAGSTAPLTDAMVFAIRDSDKGAHIAYHLAKNPQEAERISKLSPSKQAAAIVALEEKVAKPAKQPSKAPEPINPVGHKVEVQKKPEEMTDAEYSAWRRKRIAQRR